MAGQIPGIALVPQVDANGVFMAGCLLRIYTAGTSIPVIAYKDIVLTAGQEHTWPIVGDAVGRLPLFFLPDGSYRLRLSDALDSFAVFDVPSIPVIAPGGGGDGDTVTISTWEVGDVDWQPRSGTRTGWVRHNGRTIGSASSTATERANADTGNLFGVLWNRHDNTRCPVLPGGRGESAAEDFGANKTIALLDMRGYVPGGVDDMGSVAAGRFAGVTFDTGGSATVPGSTAGANTVTLSAAQLPAITPIFTGAPAAHTHTQDVSPGFVTVDGGSGANVARALIPNGGPTGSTSITPAGTISSFGSGAATPILQRTMLGTYYVRL